MSWDYVTVYHDIKICITSDAKSRQMEFQLEFLPVISQNRIMEILSEFIKERGGKEIDDGVFKISENDNWFYEIDTKNGKLYVSFPELILENCTKTVSETKERSQTYITSFEKALPKKIEVNLDDPNSLITKNVAGENELIQKADKENREIMLRAGMQARNFLTEIQTEVYRKAVRERADSLGNVLSVTESENDGTFRIRLEIEG